MLRAERALELLEHTVRLSDEYGSKLPKAKTQYGEVVGCSTSAVDNYIAKSYGIPSYKKIGHQRNARVLFNLRDVAEYLTAQTVQTA